MTLEQYIMLSAGILGFVGGFKHVVALALDPDGPLYTLALQLLSVLTGVFVVGALDLNMFSDLGRQDILGSVITGIGVGVGGQALHLLHDLARFIKERKGIEVEVLSEAVNPESEANHDFHG